MATGGDGEHSSAEELLADWRAAERDSVAAHNAASVAARAVTAAATAKDAAASTGQASRGARLVTNEILSGRTDAGKRCYAAGSGG